MDAEAVVCSDGGGSEDTKFGFGGSASGPAGSGAAAVGWITPFGVPLGVGNFTLIGLNVFMFLCELVGDGDFTGELLELVNERSEAPTPNFARLASLSFGPPGVTAGANVGAKAGTNVEVNAASSSMSDSGLLGGFDDLPPKNDFIELPLDECLLKEEDVVVPLTDAPSCCGSPRVYSEARQAELCSRGFGDGKTGAKH